METPGRYRSSGARVLYLAWAVFAWVLLVVIVVNNDSYPSVGSLALLEVASVILGAFGVRAWRLALEVWPHHVTIRNLFRSYRIPAADLRAASLEGTSAIAPGRPGQALEAECLRLEIGRSPYSVDVVATMWLPLHEKRTILLRLKRMIKNH